MSCEPLYFWFYLFSDLFALILFSLTENGLIVERAGRCSPLNYFSTERRFRFVFFYHRQKCETSSLFCERWGNRWCYVDSILEWHFIVILYASKMDEWNEFELFDMLIFSLARLCRHNKSLLANLPQRAAADRLVWMKLEQPNNNTETWCWSTQWRPTIHTHLSEQHWRPDGVHTNIYMYTHSSTWTDSPDVIPEHSKKLTS